MGASLANQHAHTWLPRPVIRTLHEHQAHLVDLARQINTFSEGTDENHSDIKELREQMVGAERIVFLGFAFHPLNVDLLLPEGIAIPDSPSTRRIFGTAFGMSDSDRLVIGNKLAGRLKGHVTEINLRTNLKCADLFQEYSQSLSMVY